MYQTRLDSYYTKILAIEFLYIYIYNHHDLLLASIQLSRIKAFPLRCLKGTFQSEITSIKIQKKEKKVALPFAVKTQRHRHQERQQKTVVMGDSGKYFWIIRRRGNHAFDGYHCSGFAL